MSSIPDLKSPVSSFVPLENERYDYLFKVVVVGDSGVGKTSLIQQLCFERFANDQKSTIGVEFNSKSLLVDSKQVKIQLWDTAGQERFRSVAPSYYRGSLGAVITYDTTYAKSFEQIQFWLNSLNQHCPAAKILVIGNKSDLVDLRAVPVEVAREFAEQVKSKRSY